MTETITYWNPKLEHIIMYIKYDKLDVNYNHCCKKSVFCHHASQLRKKNRTLNILTLYYDRIQNKHIKLKKVESSIKCTCM